MTKIKLFLAFVALSIALQSCKSSKCDCPHWNKQSIEENVGTRV